MVIDEVHSSQSGKFSDHLVKSLSKNDLDNFEEGSPDDDLSISARIADLTGRRVCVPNYPLAPENPFPIARNVIRTVYDSLSKNNEMIVIGESAGGNLAVRVILDVLASTSISTPPKAVALLSPWLDLTHSGDSHLTLDGVDPTLSVKHFLEPASLAYAGDHSRDSEYISPIFADIPSNFPYLKKFVVVIVHAV